MWELACSPQNWLEPTGQVRFHAKKRENASFVETAGLPQAPLLMHPHQGLEPLAGIAPNRPDFRDRITQFVELLKRTLSPLLLPFVSRFTAAIDLVADSFDSANRLSATPIRLCPGVAETFYEAPFDTKTQLKRCHLEAGDNARRFASRALESSRVGLSRSESDR